MLSLAKTLGGVFARNSRAAPSIPYLPHVAPAPATVFEELQSLTGLHDVKREVKRFADTVQAAHHRRRHGIISEPPSLHFVLTGNPGTGKTTIARILGRIMRHYGLLASGHTIEAERSNVVGEYIGQTAIKTGELIQSARDGVLFIDEAYTLAQGGERDFGKEAINTLLKQMEDLRTELSVIVAGYSEQMQTFIQSNPGLASRFTRYIDFPDYSPEELDEILCRLIYGEGFRFADPPARATALILCHRLYDTRDTRCGNARDIRTLWEKIREANATHIAPITRPTKAQVTQITIDDMINGYFAFCGHEQEGERIMADVCERLRKWGC